MEIAVEGRDTGFMGTGRPMLQTIAVDGYMFTSIDHNLDRVDDDAYINHIYNTTLPQLDLECFGVADFPGDVEDYMVNKPLSKKHGFKLFHVRKTGGEYLEARTRSYRHEISFLNARDPGTWSRDDYRDIPGQGLVGEVFSLALKMFQSPKFEELRILAFGDFSHAGRYADFQLLLCRAVTANPEIKFKVMSRDDIAYYKRSGLLDMNFLAACPRTDYFHRLHFGKLVDVHTGHRYFR